MYVGFFLSSNNWFSHFLNIVIFSISLEEFQDAIFYTPKFLSSYEVFGSHYRLLSLIVHHRIQISTSLFPYRGVPMGSKVCTSSGNKINFNGTIINFSATKIILM